MTRNLLFKCPRSGLTVQCRLEATCANDRSDNYDAVDCAACSAYHVISQKTGKLLGEVTPRLPVQEKAADGDDQRLLKTTRNEKPRPHPCPV